MGKTKNSTNHFNLSNDYYSFTRRIGPAHIVKNSEDKTLCGMPLLSYNYSKHKDNNIFCSTCLEIYQSIIKEKI